MSTTDFVGIVNGHLVDDHLLRGGTITAEGIHLLAKRGVVEVICLKNRKQDSQAEIDEERRWVEAEGMVFTHIPMDSSGVFSYDDGKKIPGILKMISAIGGKIFIGCAKGADRTGTVIACYRITQGWIADAALKEMRSYGSAWIHFAMRRYVKGFGG